MKKIALISMPFVMIAAISANAQPQHVNVPDFHDHFQATLSPSISSAIKYISQDGDVFNDDTYQPACTGTICTFGVTDDNQWLSHGDVTYQIGDATNNNKPYCLVTIADGALYPTALMTTSCFNGASPTALSKTGGNEYQFSINYDN